MQWERRENPEIMVHSVLGLTQIYEKIAPFFQRYHKDFAGRKLYFVSMDIQGCFDNINQHKLLQTLETLLSADEYMIRRFIQIVAFNGQVRCVYKKSAVASNRFQKFADFCKSVIADLVTLIFSVDNFSWTYQFHRKRTPCSLIKLSIRLSPKKPVWNYFESTFSTISSRWQLLRIGFELHLTDLVVQSTAKFFIAKRKELHKARFCQRCYVVCTMHKWIERFLSRNCLSPPLENRLEWWCVWLTIFCILLLIKPLLMSF